MLDASLDLQESFKVAYKGKIKLFQRQIVFMILVLNILINFTPYGFILGQRPFNIIFAY
jgi:hypothetical protein